MAKFKMTDEIATILFVVKSGVLHWSHSDAVFEPVRGKRVGSASSGYAVTSFMGNIYSTVDLVHLIKFGEWPAYEDMVTSSAAILSRLKTRKPPKLEMVESFKERAEIIERELQERYENF